MKIKSGAVFLGRIVPEKGVDTLLEAWRIVSEESNQVFGNSKLGNLLLTIVGSGPELETLRTESKDLPEIQFTGQLDHRAAMEIVKSSAVLVFPSRWAEPFGLGIIEAMAAGLPVIATNLGAPSELIDDGVTGLLVPPDDPKALSEAIISLLGQPDRIVEMGMAARTKFLNHFRPEAHSRALTDVFKSLLH